MSIPQGKIEAIQNALGIKHGFDKNICDGWAIREILEAAAEWDRAHPPQVTDAMVFSVREAIVVRERIRLKTKTIRRAIEAALREMPK